MTVACPLRVLNQEKEQVCEKFFWEKLHHTDYADYGRRISSASAELGKNAGL